MHEDPIRDPPVALVLLTLARALVRLVARSENPNGRRRSSASARTELRSGARGCVVVAARRFRQPQPGPRRIAGPGSRRVRPRHAADSVDRHDAVGRSPLCRCHRRPQSALVRRRICQGRGLPRPHYTAQLWSAGCRSASGKIPMARARRRPIYGARSRCRRTTQRAQRRLRDRMAPTRLSRRASFTPELSGRYYRAPGPRRVGHLFYPRGTDPELGGKTVMLRRHTMALFPQPNSPVQQKNNMARIIEVTDLSRRLRFRLLVESGHEVIRVERHNRTACYR